MRSQETPWRLQKQETSHDTPSMISSILVKIMMEYDMTIYLPCYGLKVNLKSHILQPVNKMIAGKLRLKGWSLESNNYQNDATRDKTVAYN